MCFSGECKPFGRIQKLCEQNCEFLAGMKVLQEKIGEPIRSNSLKRNACKMQTYQKVVLGKCRGMHLKNAEEIRRKIAIDRKIHLLEFLDFLFSRFCLFVATKIPELLHGLSSLHWRRCHNTHLSRLGETDRERERGRNRKRERDTHT